MSNLLLGIYNEFINDPKVEQWAMMSSFKPTAGIVAAYLLFVLSIGPKIMSKRKPFEPQKMLMVYNIFQIVFNIYIGLLPFLVPSLLTSFRWTCPKNQSLGNYYHDIAGAAWFYYISKVIDLFDTIFMVLRKKNNQITFLHVYHHSILCVFSFVYVKYLPAEQGVVIGMMNSIVHVIMYSYYLLASLGPKYSRFLWWKKYMTLVQLVQFLGMLVYLVSLHISDCQFPKTGTYFLGVNCFIFFLLFTKFYASAYSKKSAEKII